jgi:hypothetical protein
MITVTLQWRAVRRVAAAALLVASAAARVEAQVGIGVAYPGVPFLYYTPQLVPSPTEYLYDRANARISAYGSAVQQQAAASQMASASTNSNAYFNRIRDYSGEGTYQVTSRQSLGQRTSPRPRPTASIPAAGQSPSRPAAPSLEAFFLPGGELDWPHDAPDSLALRQARAEAEMAVKAVRDRIHSVGKAKTQDVGTAKWKLETYGKRALFEVKSARSAAVADVFHYFLLFLHQALDQAAGAGES